MVKLQYQILEYLYESNGAFFIDTANHFIQLGETPSDSTDMIEMLIQHRYITASSKIKIHAAFLRLSPLGKEKFLEYQETLNFPAHLQQQNSDPKPAGYSPNKTRWYKEPIVLQWLSIVAAVIVPIAILVVEIFF